MHPANHQRIAAGIGFDWKALPPRHKSLDGVDENVAEIAFTRERTSHRGFARLRRLRRAWVHGVHAEFLAEIVQIPTLEVLELSGVTATDLTPLWKLRGLKRLIVQDATKVESLSWVEGLVPLDALSLSNFKRVHDLTPLGGQSSLLTLGVEGSMWTDMRVDTLAPLARLQRLRSLFLFSLRAADRSLEPLHALPHLGLLQCDSRFGDEEFRRLRRAMPQLDCEWFRALDRHGSVRAAIKSLVATNKKDWG